METKHRIGGIITLLPTVQAPIKLVKPPSVDQSQVDTFAERFMRQRTRAILAQKKSRKSKSDSERPNLSHCCPLTSFPMTLFIQPFPESSLTRIQWLVDLTSGIERGCIFSLFHFIQVNKNLIIYQKKNKNLIMVILLT